MRKRTGKTIRGKFRNKSNTHTAERTWKQENTGEKAELLLLGFFTLLISIILLQVQIK